MIFWHPGSQGLHPGWRSTVRCQHHPASVPTIYIFQHTKPSKIEGILLYQQFIIVRIYFNVEICFWSNISYGKSKLKHATTELYDMGKSNYVFKSGMLKRTIKILREVSFGLISIQYCHNNTGKLNLFAASSVFGTIISKQVIVLSQDEINLFSAFICLMILITNPFSCQKADSSLTRQKEIFFYLK